MPNPDAITYIADHLAQLPDPENPGQHMMFVPYTTFPGQHDEQQKLIKANRDRTAAGIGLLLEQGGYSIVKTADITGPPMLGSHPVITIQCSVCGQPLLQLTPSQQGVATMSATTLTTIDHYCPI